MQLVEPGELVAGHSPRTQIRMVGPEEDMYAVLALLKAQLPRDPTGELYAVLGQLNPGTQPASREGVWASPDGERALLLLQTRALGSDTDGQAAAIDTGLAL